MSRNNYRNYRRKVIHHLVKQHGWDEQEAYKLCENNQEYIQGQWALNVWQTKVANFLARREQNGS
jgi:hypothetical protein